MVVETVSDDVTLFLKNDASEVGDFLEMRFLNLSLDHDDDIEVARVIGVHDVLTEQVHGKTGIDDVLDDVDG